MQCSDVPVKSTRAPNERHRRSKTRRKGTGRTWDNGSIEVPVGVPTEGIGGEGCVALAGIVTAREPLSPEAVLVLFSLSPCLSFSVPPSRDPDSLALSRSPDVVSVLENSDEVPRANLEEGALELLVPRGGRRQLQTGVGPQRTNTRIYWGAGKLHEHRGRDARASQTATEAIRVSLPRRECAL